MEEQLKRELLFSREAVQEQIKQLALRISSDYEGRDLVLIGVLNGAVFFLSDLARNISIPLKIDFVRASSYGSGRESSGTVRLTKDVEIPLQGKSVILIEDIVDSGLTIDRLIKAIEEKSPESIRVCALIDKTERRRTDVEIHYCGYRIEEGFVVGYGLDYDENYRNLPDIYVLK